MSIKNRDCCENRDFAHFAQKVDFWRFWSVFLSPGAFAKPAQLAHMTRRAPPASIPRCLRVILGGRRASSPKKVNGQKQKFRPFGPDFLAILLFVFDAHNFLRRRN